MKRLHAVNMVLLLLPAIGSAQSPAWLEVTPAVGWYAPLRDLGAAAPAGSAWFLRLGRMEPTAYLAASARLSLPRSDFALRLQGLVTLPSSASGSFACFPGLACPEVLLRTPADVTVSAASADVAYLPLEPGSPLRPFIALGAAVKRYSYAWPEPAAILDAGEYAETELVLHAGVGIEVEVAGAPLRLEVSDYWSGRVRRPWATDLAWSARPSRNAQHDLAIGLGWSVLRF